jgi:hypothetical protein
MKKEELGQLFEKNEKTINSALAGKKSIRTTLKLDKKSHHDLEWLSNYYKITIKEVLDGTFTEEFSSFFKSLINENTNKIKELKQDTNKIIEGEYIRKTYVLSEKALKILDQEAKNLKLTRDNLASVLISLHTIITKEQAEKRRKAMDLIEEFSSRGRELEKEIHELVGKDDPVANSFSSIVTQLINFENNLDLEI